MLHIWLNAQGIEQYNAKAQLDGSSPIPPSGRLGCQDLETAQAWIDAGSASAYPTAGTVSDFIAFARNIPVWAEFNGVRPPWSATEGQAGPARKGSQFKVVGTAGNRELAIESSRQDPHHFWSLRDVRHQTNDMSPPQLLMNWAAPNADQVVAILEHGGPGGGRKSPLPADAPLSPLLLAYVEVCKTALPQLTSYAPAPTAAAHLADTPPATALDTAAAAPQSWPDVEKQMQARFQASRSSERYDVLKRVSDYTAGLAPFDAALVQSIFQNKPVTRTLDAQLEQLARVKDFTGITAPLEQLLRTYRADDASVSRVQNALVEAAGISALIENVLASPRAGNALTGLGHRYELDKAMLKTPAIDNAQAAHIGASYSGPRGEVLLQRISREAVNARPPLFRDPVLDFYRQWTGEGFTPDRPEISRAFPSSTLAQMGELLATRTAEREPARLAPHAEAQPPKAAPPPEWSGDPNRLTVAAPTSPTATLRPANPAAAPAGAAFGATPQPAPA